MTLASTPAGRVQRHKLVDRAYHWLMAAAVLILLVTAFLPILGLKFEWVGIHWVTGLVLTVLVLFHIIRACFFQNFWAMMIDGTDLKAPFAKPGKYDLAQKLYHLAISVLVLSVIATGLLMWRKVDTPFWQRDPYWLSTESWGLVYAVHGLVAMALVTMIIIHVYFALRPDEWHLTRSMLKGWITSKEYQDHHDPRRWQAKDEA
ncbi:MAG TPA: cytochrome b/b6 domain-containing protein [Rhizomicrobium sp.]|nr:cytochrome b/b6 domain-containing protein [Rhizomicrobium sp.]